MVVFTQFIDFPVSILKVSDLFTSYRNHVLFFRHLLTLDSAAVHQGSLIKHIVNNLREAAKKSSFLCGPATKAFSPPPA